MLVTITVTFETQNGGSLSVVDAKRNVATKLVTDDENKGYKKLDYHIPSAAGHIVLKVTAQLS